MQLAARCSGGWLADLCGISYVVTVPAAARMMLHTGKGNVGISGGSGDISIDTGNGGVSFDNVSGALTAVTGDGNIRGTAVHSTSVRATTGNGGIGVDWASAPPDVVTKTGNGAIDLVVPSGSGPYRASTHTGNGTARVSGATDSTATAALSARTGDGGIVIRYPTDPR